MIHRLKSWPERFAPIASGVCTADLRHDDRVFEPGDRVRFEEFDPEQGKHTGQWAFVRVTFVQRMPSGYALLSFKLLNTGHDQARLTA